MTKQTPQPIKVLEPSVKSTHDKDKHALEEIFSGPEDDIPEMKAVGYMKLGKGTNNWVSYTATIKGDRVLKLEVEEPNLREIAEESAKIAFVNNFIDQEAF